MPVTQRSKSDEAVQVSGTIVFRCLFAPCFRIVPAAGVGILGRSPWCDYVVDHPSVSRKHARIHVCEAQPIVTDLKSRNGTFLDNVRVQDSGRVLPGQIVRFGNVSFSVRSEAIEDTQEETTVPGKLPGPRLSEAQTRVFDLLATGLPEKRIASELKLSLHTIHNHVRAIFRAFGVHSRAELFARLVN